MSAFAGIAQGVGTLLNSASGFFQGQAENRAGRQARDWYDPRTMANQLAVGGQYYGPAYADLLQTSQVLALARQRQDLPEMQRLQAIMGDIQSRMGGTIQNQQTRLADDVAPRQTRNEEATLEKVKDGLRVICLGTFGEEKTKMKAVRIDVRTDK